MTMSPEEGTPPNPVLLWDACKAFDPVEAGHSAEVLVMDDVIWAVDLAECIECSSAETLAMILGTETGCLCDAFSQHGLSLAFGPGKTAAICVVRGPKSRSVHKRLFGSCAAGKPCTFPVLREHGPPVQLPIVDSYKHTKILA